MRTPCTISLLIKLRTVFLRAALCIFGHENNVNRSCTDRNVALCTAQTQMRKFKEAPTFFFSDISIHNAQRRARERERRPLDNEWPAQYHRYITVWCGTKQWHSSHSKKTPCWFISCLLSAFSLVRVLKGLCLLGLNYALSPPAEPRIRS